MKIILGTAVYLLIGGAHILALERYDEGLDSAVLIWCGLCWPVTAPLFGVKLAFKAQGYQNKAMLFSLDRELHTQNQPVFL